jgi:hypothetical protein
MKWVPVVLLTAFGLAACNSDGEQAGQIDDCSVIQSINTSRADTPPFSSLRGEPVTLGDMVLDNQYLAERSPFGAQCEISTIDQFFGTDTDLHLYGCSLYERAGSFDREAREVEARALFDEARTTLTQCLGSEWEVVETTQNANFEVYHKIKLTPPEGAAVIADFTVDMMFLTLAYTPLMNQPGRGTGWRVQFQAQQPSE